MSKKANEFVVRWVRTDIASLQAGACSAATAYAAGVPFCRLAQAFQFSCTKGIAGRVVDMRDEQPPPAVQTSRAAQQEEVCRRSSGCRGHNYNNIGVAALDMSRSNGPKFTARVRIQHCPSISAPYRVK